MFYTLNIIVILSCLHLFSFIYIMGELINYLFEIVSLCSLNIIFFHITNDMDNTFFFVVCGYLNKNI